MPTRKIADVEEPKRCRDPEHRPPTMRYFPPGVYEHECPSCGHITHFTVQAHRWCAPENPNVKRRAFYINVGSLRHDEAMSYVKRFSRDVDADFFIPVR